MVLSTSSKPPAPAPAAAASGASRDSKPAERPTTLLGAIYPWGGKGGSRSRAGSAGGSDRSTSTGQSAAAAAAAAAASSASVPRPGSAGLSTNASATPDHSTNSYYGRSLRRYPEGCPPLSVKWFHAVDVPKRKAHWFDKFNKKAPKVTKPQPAPKKYVAFSVNDSHSIESAFQKELEDCEDNGVGLADKKKGPGVKVPVNEDFLFDVDIGERELAPVYWLGPVYDVRRGSWFYQEGSTLRPCEENLASQLEEGYLKAKPWLYELPPAKASPAEAAAAAASASSAAVASAAAAVTASAGDGPQEDAARPKPPASKPAATAKTAASAAPSAHAFQPETHRLFGQYMNHVATYQDATTAWLSTDGMLSWVTSTMYERFSGGAFMSGVKLVRGYSEPKKAAKEAKDAKDTKEAKEAKDDKRPGTPTPATTEDKKRHLATAPESEDKRLKALKRRSAPPSTGSSSSPSVYEARESAAASGDSKPTSEIERRGDQLKQQLSSLMGSGSATGSAAAAAGVAGGDGRNEEEEEEEIRKREEKEIQNDYTAPKDETQGRDIEHLILVTHGIGQLLGLRMESLNFIHDVNLLRKTLKSVYAASPDLRALHEEPADGPGNCRIQVLPVCWRHLLDFPRRSDAGKQERDLSDLNEDEEEYPALEDITIEGMTFARSLISDLALDVLLYQSAYREEISDIVLKESNRIHKLFLERNPGFHGTVHVIGHSLGSAIMFDILCRERERRPKKPAEVRPRSSRLRIWPAAAGSADNAIVVDDDTDDGSADDYDSEAAGDVVYRPAKKSQRFNFDVEDFYCLGSPIGLFQMIKGRTIAARPQPRASGNNSSSAGGGTPVTARSLADDDHDPAGTYYDFGMEAAAAGGSGGGGPYVSPVTGLPVSVSSPKVGQLFNVFHPSDPISYRLEPLIAPAMAGLKPQPLPYTKRGLFGGALAPQGGLTGIGAKVGQSVSGLWSSFSAGLASNLLNRSLGLSQEDVAKLEQQAAAATAEAEAEAGGDNGHGHSHGHGHGAELVDGPEVETLFSHFQKKRAALAKDSKDGAGTWKDDGARAQRMRRDEAKMRALNRNGRVDYTIQESVLDFNPINTIASHMAYWADEDVSHFIMTQLYAGQAAKKGKGV